MQHSCTDRTSATNALPEGSGSLMLQLGQIGKEGVDRMLVVVSIVRRAGQAGRALPVARQIPDLIGQKLALRADQVMKSGLERLKVLLELRGRRPAGDVRPHGVQVHLEHINESLE